MELTPCSAKTAVYPNLSRTPQPEPETDKKNFTLPGFSPPVAQDQGPKRPKMRKDT